jgi:hypothetical protein
MSQETSGYRPRCKNLLCKSMLVYGESFEQDPDYQAGVAEMWCLCTSRGQGPDGNEVTLEMCSNPERGCFQEY